MSLSKRLLRSKPAPGERRFLPNRAIPYCSHCGGELAINPHPMEKIQIVVVLIPVLLIQLILKYPISITLMILTGVSSVAAIAALAYFHFQFMRNWQRFTRREKTDR
jgi:hypothetical protein